MAMSGLEPAALNYLQVRAAGSDNAEEQTDQLERLRVKLAMGGPIAGAINKCLDMVRFVDLDAQQKLIPELDACLRQAAGFATRAAVADAVNSLCSTCPSAFKFPGNATTNPTVRLLRALYFASERERGAASKDKMTHALGSLAELAPGKAVRTLAAKACERYSESSGSNSDSAVRRAASATIRSICVRASSQMQDGGSNDVWRKVVMPTAFIGRHDKDPKVSSLWKDVWEEGDSATATDNRDGTFGVTLQEQLLPYLVKSVVAALRSLSWENRIAACAVITELAEANVLAPTPRSTDDNVSVHSSDRFKQRAYASSSILSECVKIIRRSRVWAGKADVVKAGVMIAGKWASIAAVDGAGESRVILPIVLQKDYQNDLFLSDGWFTLAPETTNDKTEDEGLGCNKEEPANNDDVLTFENEGVLDFASENEFPEEDQVTDIDMDDRNSSNGSQQVTFAGFCRVLCDQGLRTNSNETVDGILPYKAAALGGLSSLLQSLCPSAESSSQQAVVSQQRAVYQLLVPRLFAFVKEKGAKPPPPLLIAKSLESLASAMYNGVGNNPSSDYDNALILLGFLSTETDQAAWTVRQTSALAAASLVANMASTALRKNDVITTVLECASKSLNDRKFWRVRQAGLELILSLVSRVGKQRVSDVDSESQLLMEAILPYKEKIIDIARQSLRDNESQVTATASKITLTLAWWP